MTQRLAVAPVASAIMYARIERIVVEACLMAYCEREAVDHRKVNFVNQMLSYLYLRCAFSVRLDDCVAKCPCKTIGQKNGCN